MKPIEEHEIGICPVCGSCMLKNGKGMYVGDGYVELEVKCEECGFHGTEEYSFSHYRSGEGSLLQPLGLPLSQWGQN